MKNMIFSKFLFDDHNRRVEKSMQCQHSSHHRQTPALLSRGFCCCLISLTVTQFYSAVFQCANNQWNRRQGVLTSVTTRTNSRGCSVSMSKGQNISNQALMEVSALLLQCVCSFSEAWISPCPYVKMFLTLFPESVCRGALLHKLSPPNQLTVAVFIIKFILKCSFHFKRFKVGMTIRFRFSFKCIIPECSCIKGLMCTWGKKDPRPKAEMKTKPWINLINGRGKRSSCSKSFFA